MATITIYSDKSCDACRQIVPIVKSLAKKKGLAVKVVDVDKCHTPKCDSIHYVPFAEIDKKKVSLKKLAKILK